MLDGVNYTVVGKIRKKEQDSNTTVRQQQDSAFAAMLQDMPRKRAPIGACPTVAPKPWVVDQLPRVRTNAKAGSQTLRPRTTCARCWRGGMASTRGIARGRHVDTSPRPHVRAHDDRMRDFFTSWWSPGARRHRCHEHHAGRGEGTTRYIKIRKALGARPGASSSSSSWKGSS